MLVEIMKTVITKEMRVVASSAHSEHCMHFEQKKKKKKRNELFYKADV